MSTHNATPASTTFPNGATYRYDGRLTITVDKSPLDGEPDSWTFPTVTDAVIAWVSVVTH